ncbi:Hypothetical Protein PANA_2936 [Pantoea ananatis LMG 20103]|uniref:Uncharacterized protein n=1 Tax=Pantoea ananatis (strain LMG 20103) TaxID=706191 RepID=D4GKR4_PANAM|nr:hypothetical protein [Pantoea ananatis]ADD78103.1 Hypothetical Protein PANA_2936 [Pantoea ananatis LMG 20103]
MMLLIFKFTLPYFLFCNLAAWGLAQNLEGLKLFHYINDMPQQYGGDVITPWNISPLHGVKGLSDLLTIILIPIFLLNVRAAFYLNRIAGWFSLSLWCLPGFLSLLGFVPDFHSLGPDKFLYGTNFTGSTPSAAANLIICLVAGWSAIMLISAFWKKTSFKNFYDHIWYVLGLVAALYFVVDSGLPSYKDDLSEAGEKTTLILQRYRDNAQNLYSLCKETEVQNLAPDLCQLASSVRWSSQNQLDSKDMLRARIDLPDWVDRLASYPPMAVQIDALNKWACSPESVRGNCQTLPIEMVLGHEDFEVPMVFLPSPYAKELAGLHISMQTADEHIQEIERGHNGRYFVFLMLAFVAGGKLANASRSMAGHDTIRPRSWLFICFGFVFKNIILIIRLLMAHLVLPILRRLEVSGNGLIKRCRLRAANSAETSDTYSDEG